MAISIALQLKPKKFKTLHNPTFLHFFSSDANDGGGGGEDKKNPNLAQSFLYIKSSLKQQSPSLPRNRLSQPQPQNITSSSSSFSPSQPKYTSLEEIRKNLSEFRLRSAPPSHSSPPHQQQVLFSELYRKNVMEKGQKGSTTTTGTNQSVKVSLDAIRNSLRKMPPNQNQNHGGNKAINPNSLKELQHSVNIKREDRGGWGGVIGGSENVPLNFLRKGALNRTDAGVQYAKNELLKNYDYGELGEKLRKLRPAEAAAKGGSGENWFSLKELNERLKKLREEEEKESEVTIVGVSFKELRQSILRIGSNENTKKSSLQTLHLMGQLGGTPSFMLAPPKEQLVEKFFHPDNMSSAEKLKLELKKARDEFKLSESDCGSSRVQVAQLTTKIKHLSSVLHKKDKHSRKGLQDMVQKRKKLLRYLRRTDWDSYCLCLSKLGLRDNPDYKN